MSLKERLVVLLLIISSFLIFNSESFARPLTDNENATLLTSVSNRSIVDMTIDLLWSNEIEMKPDAVRKIKQTYIERMNKIPGKMGHIVEMPLYGFVSPSGSNIRLVETRTRIGSKLRLRNDTVIFGDRKKTKVQYETTTINANPFGTKTVLNYKIDHKLKQGLVEDKITWSGEEVLQFGKVDLDIYLDILKLAKYGQKTNSKLSKYYNLSYEGDTAIDGHLTDVLQCKNPANDKLRYIVYLDTSNWQLCRKIERYNNTSGLLSQITEYKAFEQIGDGSFPYPRSVIRRYFDKDGKEERSEKINIENVEIGIPIPDEVFKFNVPSDYTITDMRSTP
jgi:hypothetical protein